jgi:hypothetical protein
MRRLMLLGAVVMAAMVAGGPAAAHNAGCVQTGTGEWVFVGSNNRGPFVPEQNPNRNTTDEPGRLDLQPGSGDQYGARHAVNQGDSAVEGPLPTRCTAPESRA